MVDDVWENGISLQMSLVIFLFDLLQASSLGKSSRMTILQMLAADPCEIDSPRRDFSQSLLFLPV